MSASPSAPMADALRLTREGRLTEAVAVIQGHLAEPTRPSSPHADSSRPGTPRAVSPGADSPRAGSDALIDTLVEALDRSRPAARTLAALLADRPRGGGPAGGARGLLGHATRPAQAPGSARRGPGQLSSRVHSGPAGSRRYDLYVPTSATGAPAPLLVMLHGGRQTPADFAAGTRMDDLAERHGFLVAYPEQTTEANSGRYWNWFRPQDQRRDGGEPAILAGIAREVAEEHAVEESRVYAAGFSAGGAMSAVLAATHPDLFAAVGVHSGLGYGAASDVSSAFAAMRTGGTPRSSGQVPLVVVHGDRDRVVAPVNATKLVEAHLRGSGARTRAATAPLGGPGASRTTRTTHTDVDGRVVAEQWTISGGGHTWFGGSPAGSYTDPTGPDASEGIVRFLLTHRRATVAG